MKRTLLRTGSLLLALLMLFSMVPAFAAEDAAGAADAAETAEAPAAVPTPAEPNDTVIDSVYITLDEPTHDAYPDYTAEYPAGAHYYSADYSNAEHLNDILWERVDDGVSLIPGVDVFEAGYSYIVQVYVTAEVGYMFSYNTSVWLNGCPTEMVLVNDQLLVEFTFPALEYYPISLVSVWIDVPEPDGRPDYTAVFPTDAHYYSANRSNSITCNDIVWWDETDWSYLSPASSVFEVGHEYTVEIYLTAEPNYMFSVSPTVLLNGIQVSSYQSSGQLVVSYTFPPLREYIGYISVTIDPPVKDMSPDYTAEFPLNPHYYSAGYNDDNYRNDILWVDASEEFAELDPDTDVFQAGHIYKVIIYLTAEENCAFEDVIPRVNGELAGRTLMSESTYMKVEFTFPAVEDTVISSVDITIDTPMYGASPDYTAEFPAGSHCYTDPDYNESNFRNDVLWIDMTRNVEMDPDSDTFVVGHIYKVTVYVTADDPFEFDDNVTATVNGMNASSNPTGQSNYMYVIYTFPEVPDTVVYQTSVLLDEPMPGASPDYTPTLPAGAHYYSADYNEYNYRNDVLWLDLTEKTQMDPDTDVFQVGHQYNATIYLTAEDGWAFYETVDADVNGYMARSNRNNLTYLFTEYTFPTLEAFGIYSQPDDQTAVEGSSACFEVGAAGFGLTYQWQYKTPTGSWKNCSSTTQGYNTAILTVQATAARSGYQYRCIVSDMNGDSETSAPATLTVLTSLSHVAVILDAPVSGSRPDYTAEFPAGAHYTAYESPNPLNYSRGGIIWYDVDGWTALDPDVDVFLPGHTYEVEIDLAANDGCGFPFNAEATVNGEAATAICKQPLLMHVSYEFPALSDFGIVSNPADVSTLPDVDVYFHVGVQSPGTSISYQWQYKTPTGSWQNSTGVGCKTDTLTVHATSARNGYQYRCKVTSGETIISLPATLTVLKTITSVSVTFDEPEVSAQPDCTATLPAGAHYSVRPMNESHFRNGIRWSEDAMVSISYMEAGDVFRPGYAYRVDFYLDAEVGYVFSENVTVKVNGQSALYRPGNGSLWVYYTFPALPSFAVTVQPQDVTAFVGETVQFHAEANVVDAVPAYQWQYKVPGGSWKNSSSTGYNTDTLTVQATLARNGYQYRCRISVAGADPLTTKPATLTVVQSIDFISVELTPPAVGAHPDYTAVLPADAHYHLDTEFEFNETTRNGVFWYLIPINSNNNIEEFDPDTYVFQSGEIYALIILIAPDEGYAFSPNATAELNGEQVSFEYFGTGRVFRYFPPLPNVEITLHPADVTAIAGETVQFHVEANGSGLTYQWQYKTPAGDWKNSASTGCRTDTLTVAAEAKRNGYQYKCLVTAGGTTVPSDPATLTVISLSITESPADVTASVGETVHFHVTAAGPDLTYQWQYKTPTGTWKNSTGTGYNTDTLTVQATAARSGYQYRCLVTCSGVTLPSDPATLTVISISITEQPADVSATVGETVQFHVTATGSNLTYQWQYKTPTGTWKNSTGTGCSTDTLTVVAEAKRNGYQYQCIVTAGSTSVTSDPATLTVSSFAITAHPQDVTAAVGETVQFHVTATGSNLTYQWQYKTPTGTWKNSTGTGCNTDTLTVVAETKRNGYQYQCIVTAGSTSLTSDPATLTVGTPAPVFGITSQPADVYAKDGTSVTFTVAAAGEGLTYQWQYRTPTGTWKNCTTGSYNTATLTVTAAPKRNYYQYHCIVTDGSGETATSDAAVLTVFAVTKNPSNASGPVNSTVEFSVTAIGSSLTYQWQYKTPTGTWKNCSGATIGYNTAALTVTVTQTRNGYQYRCVVTDETGETITSAAATLTAE